MNEYCKPESMVLALDLADNNLLSGNAEDMNIKKDDWD